MAVPESICERVCPDSWIGCSATRIACTHSKIVCCFECWYTQINHHDCSIEHQGDRYFRYLVLTKGKEKNERNSIK